ncbi:hypothetical protein O4_67 [Pseudomonas phage O4]|uniref:hypothetical protein n=1 Tax=Pseudomonas phage O4 TaxID=1784982 RepID=UPI00078E6EED|nr:hypothetical protein BJD45_gp75 [Pseudomonas phage O4]AMO43542.1 hypothetical protein O4_67 [Pseudomonas phage O4]
MANLPKARPGNEWIEWDGGECPVPYGTKVDIIYRDGYKTSMSIVWLDFNHNVWSHLNDEGDIVAYRVSWIRHRGGKRPGKPGDKFEVRFRNGTFWEVKIKQTDFGNALYWDHIGVGLDIMAYRPVI